MLAHQRPGVRFDFREIDGEIRPIVTVPFRVYIPMLAELVGLVIECGLLPDLIVAVPFGGVYPARYVSQTLRRASRDGKKIPIAYFGAESYDQAEPGGQHESVGRERVRHARHLLVTCTNLGDDPIEALGIDDVWERGLTAQAWNDHVDQQAAENGIRIMSKRFGVLWYKPTQSKVMPLEPEIVVDTVVPVRCPDGEERVPWIVQEPIETIDPGLVLTAYMERCGREARAPLSHVVSLLRGKVPSP